MSSSIDKEKVTKILQSPRLTTTPSAEGTCDIKKQEPEPEMSSSADKKEKVTKVTKIPSLEISGNGRNLLSTRPNTPPEQPNNPRDPKVPQKTARQKTALQNIGHKNTTTIPPVVPPNIKVRKSTINPAQYKPKCLPKKPKVTKMPKEGISLLNWMKNGQNLHTQKAGKNSPKSM